jgi:hypothetical protein
VFLLSALWEIQVCYFKLLLWFCHWKIISKCRQL